MEKVYNTLLTNNKIKYGDTIVVAVSGGPDSMALLHILSRLKKAIDIEVVCAHVNHNVRKESYNEKVFVENFCVNHQIVFESMVIEDYGDDNFHNEARSKRYSYFAEIVKKHHAKYLLTAHHADDLIETILMRIVRGSTLRGYSGFSEELDMGDYVILRPFIKNTKDEILAYLKENKLSYAQDSSNFKDVYTRNRFRKYIVPQFKKEDPNVHQKFYKFSRTLLEYNNYIDNQVEKVMKKVYKQETLNIESFLKEEKVIQMKIIYNILEHIYHDDLMLITDHHADLLYNTITSKRANVAIHLPNNIQAVKTYNNLILVPIDQTNHEYEIELITYVNLPNGKNIEVVDKSDETDNFVCRLDKNEVKFPLHVRNRKNGDKMYIKGMLGRKKISDIFIDEKIGAHDRDVWPIVVDSEDNIVWLPGLKKSKFDKTKKEKYDIILRYY
ncbi:MAG: tRNA lysidine(34) synthetase TilS [Bacilli bacterium]|nr:tRNA lysidine(34) synthetase TilS [Bacilli bacterium]MDD4809073.1 tRNA lysidine(34) synthetase TilS [Bacilli bacterium]